MKKKLTYIALSCAILLSVTVLFINAQAPERAKIAFESGRRQADQRAEIFIMDVDGKLQEPLIEEEAGGTNIQPGLLTVKGSPSRAIGTMRCRMMSAL